MHPLHLPFPRRSHVGVVITGRASRGRPRRFVLPGAVRVVAFGVLALVAVAGAAAAAWLLAGGGISSVAAGLFVPAARGSDAGQPVAGGVPLRAATWPGDAQVLVDGHTVGTTPVVTSVLPGPHQVTLRRSGELDATRELDVPVAGATLDVALWHTQPTAVKLRPAYPGAAIADAQFLTDGRIALVLLLPASGGAISVQPPLREVWLLDPTSGHLDAFAPSIRAAALAVSPSGARVAYLQQAPPPPPGQAAAGAGTDCHATCECQSASAAGSWSRSHVPRSGQEERPRSRLKYDATSQRTLACLARPAAVFVWPTHLCVRRGSTRALSFRWRRFVPRKPGRTMSAGLFR